MTIRLVGALKLKAQIVCGREPAMGPGKAELLQMIDQEGSISAAARAMGMSYRRAWNLVDEMNRHFKAPLVETARGGTDNGARLSPTGHKVLAAYIELERDLLEAAGGWPLTSLTAMLNAMPAPKVGKPLKPEVS